MINPTNEVELQQSMMEIAQGQVGVSQDVAIRKMAENECFLMSHDEVAWRNNLKPSDVVYIWDSAGMSYGSHFHRVVKIGRLNIHTIGITHGISFHGESFTTKHNGQYEIQTGRLAGTCVNKSVAIHSVPANPWHKKGLSEKEYKEAWLHNSPYSQLITPNPLYGKVTEEQLHEMWLEYKRND